MQYHIWFTVLFPTDGILIIFYYINNWKSLSMLISYFLHVGVTFAFSTTWELYLSKFCISEQQRQTVGNNPCIHTHKYVVIRTSNPPGFHRSLLSLSHDFHWWLLPRYLTQASTSQQFKKIPFTNLIVNRSACTYHQTLRVFLLLLKFSRIETKRLNCFLSFSTDQPTIIKLYY